MGTVVEGRRIPPLGAGRRSAGLALLGWLDDPSAPRLCRVAGASAAGKSHLLAWLVLAGTTPETPIGQRVHAVLPADGVGVRGAAWSLGRQLDLLARDPEELIAALAADDRRTVVCVPELDLAVDPVGLVTGLLLPMLELPQVKLVVEAGTGGPAASALGDPAAAAVLDLDDPQWTDRQRFTAWCAKRGADAGTYPSPGRALGPAERPRPAGVVDLLARVPMTPAGRLDLRAAGEDLLTEIWMAIARAGDSGPPSPALSLLADPLLAVLARPLAVAAALEAREGMSGTRAAAFARAWNAAGPALVDEPDAAVRAAVLRARLLGVDDAAAAVLAEAAGPAGLSSPWSARWARWREASAADAWPGPAVAAACYGVRSSGRASARILLADPSGIVRMYDAADGSRVGSVPVANPKPLRGLAVAADGSVLLLDAWGAVELVPRGEPGPGVEALVAEVTAVRAAAGGALSAVAAVHGLEPPPVAFGDDAGAVHWCEDGEDPDGIRSVRLHQGPVTALAAALLGGGGGDDADDADDADDDPGFPLLVSGGLDGAVRLWGPDSDPMPAPSDQRAFPVTAVAVAAVAGDRGGDGDRDGYRDPARAGLTVAAAWSDGLVRVRNLDDPDGVVELRLGSPVDSMALTAGGLLVLGLPDGVVAIDL